MLGTILKKMGNRVISALGSPSAAPSPRAVHENESYWTAHNVTNHQTFASIEESLAYLDWRNDQYPGYLELMPLSGQDGKVVLDYGCGPGHDLVGFGHYSRPARLIGVDISPSSLQEARNRLALHRIAADLVHVPESNDPLPFADASIDYLHSSGVVHHAADPARVLREFRRVLKPNGACRIMVYHYHSLWLHLYVAYVKQIKEGFCAGMDVRSAFARTTDGVNCPISRVYKPDEFIRLAEQCGFACRFVGAAVSLIEMALLPLCSEAGQWLELAAEHRKFLQALTFDGQGFPVYQGHRAGIDGCFELTPNQED
jgi:SAM-dependent methyltransferase